MNFHSNEASHETLPAGAQGPLQLFRSLPEEVERLRRNERQVLLVPVLSVENITLPIHSRQDCSYVTGLYIGCTYPRDRNGLALAYKICGSVLCKKYEARPPCVSIRP